MAVDTLVKLQACSRIHSFRKVMPAAEAAGVLLSSWTVATNIPATGASASSGSGSTCVGSTAGNFLDADLTGDVVVSSIAGFVDASQTTSVMFCDRLWHASGLTVTTTTAQNINSVVFPARCLDGTANGLGVMLGVEVTTATTNAGAITNMTASYTNQDGTAGRTATIASFPATCVVNSFIPFRLQAGDTGVRSVQTVTLGTSLVTGAINIVAYIPKILYGNVSSTRPEPASLDRALTRLPASCCLFMLESRSSTTAQNYFGSLTVANG